MDSIKARFEALIAPHCRAKFRSRGKRHGHNQWQKDHAKAVDHPPTLSRWQNDEIFRASQVATGWTETYVKYFDYFTTVDIKHDAPHRQRNRYENMIFMRSDDPYSQAGPLWTREDYKTITSALMCLQQEQGKGMPHIPMPVRTRQHNTLDRTIQQYLEPADALLNTDFILFFVMVTKLDMVEFSTLGQFSSVSRVATRRMARPQVVGEIVSEDNRRFMFILALRTNSVSTVAKVDLSSQFSLQSCTFTSYAHSRIMKFFVFLTVFACRHVVNATGVYR